MSISDLDLINYWVLSPKKWELIPWLLVTQNGKKLHFYVMVIYFSWNWMIRETFQSTVWKSCKKHDHHLNWKIIIFSVKSTFLLKKLLKSWFHGNFWAWSRFIVIFNTVHSQLFAWNHFILETDFTEKFGTNTIYIFSFH